MVTNTYTEEEFKKVLKNLFVEKKKVRDLEKQLDEKGLQKRFQTKLTDIHKFSLAEQYAELKAAYLEKEQQIAKMRPALKKVMIDLKSAGAEITLLKASDQSEALKTAQDELRVFQDDLKRAQEALTHAKLHEQHFEAERDRLMERLAEVLSQMQRQAEMLTQQRVEIKALQSQVEQDKEAIIQLRQALERAEIQWQESDFALLRREYETKVQEALVTFSQKEVAHEESLERGYVKMREMSENNAALIEEREILYKKLAQFENTQLSYEEIETELRKGQQHLAKKVKETTLLRDLAESQKIQITELQALHEKQKGEIDRLQQQRTHDEKMQEMWQNKYLALEQDWEEKKGQLIELQKLRKTYEQMATTFSSLQNILGNARESSAETQDPGH